MKREEFIKLYLLCFPEDEPQDAEKMWQLSVSGKLLCHKIADQPVSMLLLLPATLKGDTDYKLYYIFAACTHPDYRSQGIMEKMLEKAYSTALEDGKQGVFLRPASKELCRYYSRRGFEPFSYYTTKEKPVEKSEDNFYVPDFSEFCALRKKKLEKPFIEWENPFLRANFDYLSVFSDGENLLVCEFNDNTLCVREHFGNTDKLVSAIAKKFNCEKVLARHFGCGEPYALIRTQITPPNSYVGLTLDAFK